MEISKQIENYISDVLSGTILTGELLKLTIKRHMNDLSEGAKRGLYFDKQAAEHVILFVENYLYFTKGKRAGQHFTLETWQKFQLWVLFGWKKKNGARRFNYAYHEIARKNGKTTLAAAIALYTLLADGEEIAEIYTAATTRDQAKLCFTEAQNITRKSPFLKKYLTVMEKSVFDKERHSSLKALSGDAGPLDGLNIHCSIIDEFHAHKTAEVYNVLKSSLGSRFQPLIYIVTTAGFNKEYPCYNLRKVCVDILKGLKFDDTMFVMICSLDEDDDYNNHDNWIKANPNIDVSISSQYLDNEYNQAINNPDELNNFLTKNLNIWTTASKAWITDNAYTACNGNINPDNLKNMKCWAGLDLANVKDLTALALIFPKDNDFFDVLMFFYLPEMTARERVRKDNVNYDVWIREGWITETPGNVTDYNYIFADITGEMKTGQKALKPGIAETYNLQKLAYDRFNSSQLIVDIGETGLQEKLLPFGQGFRSMSTPTKGIEKLILNKQINNGSNPVLAWNFQNVEIQRDAAGNVKVNKAKSIEKVDGVIALIMAYGAYLDTQNEQSESIYATRGLLTL